MFTGAGGSQPIVLVGGQIMNGYGAPSNQEYHHYYGPNGEEVPAPGAGFSGRASGYFPNSMAGIPQSYTVVGMMESGRVMGIDPEVSTPGVSHLPTQILQELQLVYGHLPIARFSVSCSAGRFSIQAEVLPPRLPPPPPHHRPPYLGDSHRGGRHRGGRRGSRHSEDEYNDNPEDEIVIEIPMETYKKLQAQKRRHGRKPEILIDDNPGVYEGHPMQSYRPPQNPGGYSPSPHPGGHNQNNNARPNQYDNRSNYGGPPPPNTNRDNPYNNGGGQAYLGPEDMGQLVQEYRRRQHAKHGGKDDGDQYEPTEMQTERQIPRRHSEGAGTDMGAPPDSYIMDKYLNQ